MHELLLFGTVHPSRHHQVLNILAGIAAMQPQPVLEKHLIFKPNRSPVHAAQRHMGGAQDIQQKAPGAQANQGQEMFYMHLVADVEEKKANAERDVSGHGGANGVDVVMEESGKEADSAELTRDEQERLNVTKPASPPTKWALQFRDFPDPSRQRPVTSRLITDTPLTSGDPMAFMKALDYTHISTYILRGHRYTHASTSLLLYRIHIPTTTPPTKEKPHPIDLSRPTNTTVDLSKTRLLDPLGTYILQAAIRVQDGSKIETMGKAVSELLGLKEMMRGCVELDMGDRLAADTRVR